MAKELKTLPEDIYKLFDPNEHHELDEGNLNEFAENMKDLLRMRFAKREEREHSLRFSMLGKPDRQVWFDAHPEPGTKEELLPKVYLKFLYGDVIEQLILLLAKEAGHSVEQEQAEVDVLGVKGHIDAIIDGTVVDVKSASSFGYKKFESNTVTEDDPFGYVAQLSGYADVLTPGEEAAWVAVDKVAGDICVSTLAPVVIKHHPPQARIEELRKVVESETPPERCYSDKEDGKSGNRRLDVGCSYCSHKFRCWPGLRTFIYSSGPRYLTTVAREPDVSEIKGPVVEV